ncbi:sulfatase-like hydrolase/transferase [bacterium]|nr:sulfatase-like hydrolase/transferase [bacterium]
MTTKTNRLLLDSLSRRDALKMMGALSVAGLGELAFPEVATALGGKSKQRPNIIFILGDNHNANLIGCAGHPFIKTPGMDRLAREGVIFEKTFNTTSLCSPSRASILTGAYAHRHGVRNNHTPWTGQMTTFLEHLSNNGYDTAFIGKWHMPGKGLPDMPFLDLFVSYTYREGQGSYFNCPMIVNGEEMPSRREYITEEVTDWAIEFMETKRTERNGKDSPFCIYLSHRPGHPPCEAPKDLRGMYDNVKLDLPKEIDSWWFGKMNQNVFQGIMMGSYEDQYRKYCEVITAMDRDIEHLLDKVDESGLGDNTIVVYLGDNGMQWGTHGRHGIREPYEESARLPFIVRAPGLIQDPGSRREQMALNIDMAPTLLDLAGIPVPTEMDGKSLLPILKDIGVEGRKAFLMEFWKYYPENTPSYMGVRTETHKYIEFEKGREPWLFDLINDPRELNNLFGTADGEKLLPILKRILQEQSANASVFSNS